MAQITTLQPYGVPGRTRTFTAKTAAALIAINIIAASMPALAHVADASPNLVIAGDIEVQGDSYFGSLTNYSKFADDGELVLAGTAQIGIGVSPLTRLTIEGTLTLKEQANADGDTAAYGQLWVKNTTPCQLWFTSDTGVDVKLGLVIGSDVQAYDAGLASLAELTYATASFIKMTGANTFALRTIAQTADDLEGTIDHANLANLTIVAHDTTATGANLTSLTDNSIVDTLHRHSELVASDGNPDPALSVDATGNVGIGTITPGALLEINGLEGSIGDGRYSLFLLDDTSLAAGVGSGISLGGVYNSGGSQTTFAMVWGEKENATDGNYAGQLHLGTRVNGGIVSSDLVIDSSGGIKMFSLKSGTTQGGAGAAANELWVDTDDDNTIKLGT